jgi:hypothetical protein
VENVPIKQSEQELASAADIFPGEQSTQLLLADAENLPAVHPEQTDEFVGEYVPEEHTEQIEARKTRKVDSFISPSVVSFHTKMR